MLVDIEPLDELQEKRITRIVTSEFPKYFALVSRVRVATKMVGPEGAIISSTVIPQAQAVFPEGALKKPTKIGLQVSNCSYQQLPVTKRTFRAIEIECGCIII